MLVENNQNLMQTNLLYICIYKTFLVIIQIAQTLPETPTENLYTLAGIAPPDIRRTVASMKERQRQINDKRHPLSGHVPTTSRLKSRESFIHSVTPLETSANSERVRIWKQRLRQHPLTMAVPVTEVLPPGADSGWTEWKTLNRLRTGVGRCKVNLCK